MNLNPIRKLIKNHLDEFIQWRKEIHSKPEIAFEEFETSKFVQEKLVSFGIEVESNWAKTGVIGEMISRKGKKNLGFRAELDALPLQEENDFFYKSRYANKMHACGHDGHIVGLLGAAKILSLYKEEIPNSIYFIFQPAEENEGGAKKMIEEGLLSKIHLDSIYSIHNWPELKEGIFGLKSGPIMSAYDSFIIQLKTNGTHAAMPHQGGDVVFLCSLLIQNLYATLSRTNPIKNKLISFTSIHTGTTYNVLPDVAELKGTIRTFDSHTRSEILELIQKLLKNLKEIYNFDYSFSLKEGYPATVNQKKEIDFLKWFISSVFGENKFVEIQDPSMGSEDFSYFLQKVSGAYIWLGSSKENQFTNLHNPKFDFNDSILEDLIFFWTALAFSV
ncbi:MAG: M20 family metallopeptidase [Leptonema sp. (in: bacteria)]